jgi:hypothetical protein
MGHSILLIWKKIIFFFLLIVFICGACASNRHRPRHKSPKKKRCDCPHFTQKGLIYKLENHTIETEKTNG